MRHGIRGNSNIKDAPNQEKLRQGTHAPVTPHDGRCRQSIPGKWYSSAVQRHLAQHLFHHDKAERGQCSNRGILHFAGAALCCPVPIGVDN